MCVRRGRAGGGTRAARALAGAVAGDGGPRRGRVEALRHARAGKAVRARAAGGERGGRRNTREAHQTLPVPGRNRQALFTRTRTSGMVGATRSRTRQPAGGPALGAAERRGPYRLAPRRGAELVLVDARGPRGRTSVGRG